MSRQQRVAGCSFGASASDHAHGLAARSGPCALKHVASCTCVSVRSRLAPR
jgi:hypothetical protein